MAALGSWRCPIVFREREHGDWKLSAWSALESVWLVLGLRSGRRRWEGARERASPGRLSAHSGDRAGVPMTRAMKAEELATILSPPARDDTRRALARWRRDPVAVLWPWTRGALAVAALLLAAVWVVGTLAAPDPSGSGFPGVTHPATAGDFAFVLYRNGLVLGLHAMACIAGFMAGSSLPAAATGYTGLWRKVHDRAGPLAIAFVIGATAFSLGTQAYALGLRASDLSAELGVSPLVLLLGLLPHAVPELTALFLPLAAWTIASRRKAWDELLAATIVTVAVAAPVLVVAAAIETWVTPDLLAILSEA